MINKKAYILQNHKFLTVAQMADELGVADWYVRDLCEKLEVVAITPKQQAIDYVLEHHEKKSAKEIGVVLEVTERSVRRYFKELGLNKRRGRPSAVNNYLKVKNITHA